MDRISSLPDPLIEHILERLPQKDRVRTSTLSRRWRFQWTRLSSLVLDKQFYSSVRKTNTRPVSDYQFIITGLTLQHKDHARDLSLFIPNDFGTYGDWSFDHLIKRFLLNGAQILSVEKDGTSPYRVPSFVMCSTFSLTHLKLCNCEFSLPSSFEGFSTLFSFELHHCEVRADVISRTVASSPTLQKLVLQGLNIPNQILDIDGLELRHLSVHGKFKWLYLLNSDKLEVLTIDMEILPDSSEGLPTLVANFFHNMPNLEKIILRRRFSELLARHSDMLKFAKYDGLRSLAFVQLGTADMLVYAWKSIRCFPNLTELTISMNDGAGGQAEMKDEEYDYALERLIKVDFQNISGTSFWMNLIKCSLRSPVLKLLSIKFDSRICPDKMLDHVREITKFHRASKTAEVDISKCAYTAPPPQPGPPPPKKICHRCGREPNYCTNCSVYFR